MLLYCQVTKYTQQTAEKPEIRMCVNMDSSADGDGYIHMVYYPWMKLKVIQTLS
jgi:hypothetical protein